MLSSFYIRNFRSILELRLDLSYGEGKAPNGYQAQETLPFIEVPNKARVVPCAALFGANASGKTNVLKALIAMKQMLRDASKLADLFEPNLLNPKFTETTFELVFYHGVDCFTYRIEFNASAISLEVLQKNDRELFAIRDTQPVFSPRIRSTTYSNDKLSDIFRVECTDGQGHQTKLFLHRIGFAYQGLHPDLRNAFDFIHERVRVFTNELGMPLPFAVGVLASAMGGDEAAALREITDVVRRLDIDIAAIDVTAKDLGPEEPPHRGSILKEYYETGKRQSILITASHLDVAGNSVLLDFIKHESAGTQRLAGLIGLILHTLKLGGVLLVDELECSLHPLLMREIVLLFKKRRHNPNGAQLIFTTHNTDILDDSILRLSEIVLLRKTVANGTLVRRLVDAKNDGEDIRNVTNFRKQYLAGFYSGVPHPAL